MNKKVNCIMLIDDNPHDNYFHTRVIRNSDAANVVIVKESAEAALDYLRLNVEPDFTHPDLIFLDINMPGMNGWEFLDEYAKLDENLKSKVVVVMLTTSVNPRDEERAKECGKVIAFKTKPLTPEILDEILDRPELQAKWQSFSSPPQSTPPSGSGNKDTTE